MTREKYLLKRFAYKDVYTLLKDRNYRYTLDSISKDFSHIDDQNIYCYLLYLLSIEDTCENHLLICDFLMFKGTFFHDIYPVIGWHLRSALKINPINIDVLSWIIDVFYTHPDSPFSNAEIYEYSKRILSIRPDSVKAQKISATFEE